MLRFLYWILGRRREPQKAFGVALGLKKKIGQKQRVYNVLELKEHLSLGSGAGSDLLKPQPAEPPLQRPGRKKSCI